MKYPHCPKCVNEAVWVDLYTTTFQALLRITFGFLSGSVALGTQGIYSFADATMKVINLVSVRISKRTPTRNFPYGFGKIEFISSLIIGASLMVGAVLFLYDKIGAGFHNEAPPSAIAFIGIIISALISEFSYRYLGCVGRENNSSTIIAAAWDNRTDAISSVVVFIGVLLSLSGWEEADFVAALLVALLVFRIGGSIALDALRGLLDLSLPHHEIAAISRLCRRQPGVVEVIYCRGRSLGATHQINIHLAIDERLSASELNQLLASLQDKIHDQQAHIAFLQISTTAVNSDAADYSEEASELVNAFRAAVDK
ncbi:MAG: cation transporter [Gammaproteobacteria bacterium]|nr:cation transporter [Gammaproteobacteria bacterium]